MKSILLKNRTYSVVKKALLIVKDFHIRVFLPKNIFVLLSFKKNIPKIIANLVLATKNIF